MHHWSAVPFANEEGTDLVDKEWDAFYHRIAVVNNLLNVAPDFRGQDAKTDAKLDATEGTCYFLRAWNYFMLANIYGAPYDKANLNDHASITYKTTAEVETGKFSRDNTGYVYDQIVADLEKATALLANGSIRPGNRLYPDKDACYALLSRVYLYMERYQDAIDAAKQVKSHPLTTLTGYAAGTSLLKLENTEVIFAQGTYGINNFQKPFGVIAYPEGAKPGTAASSTIATRIGAAYIVSDELKNLFWDGGANDYNANDLRTSAFFALSFAPRTTTVAGRPPQSRYLMCRKFRMQLPMANNTLDIKKKVNEIDAVTKGALPTTQDGTNINEAGSIRYAEVVLNRAEAEACAGRLTDAATTITRLLDARYKAGFLPAVPAAQDALIDFIRLERRKELWRIGQGCHFPSLYECRCGVPTEIPQPLRNYGRRELLDEEIQYIRGRND